MYAMCVYVVEWLHLKSLKFYRKMKNVSLLLKSSKNQSEFVCPP